MNDYIATRITLNHPDDRTTDITDLLAMMLGQDGYESFEPDAQGLTAYIKDSLFDDGLAARRAIDLCPIPLNGDAEITHTKIEGQDWNSEWEKNYFHPIVVADQCVIHSSFHKDYPRCPYDIVIDPKMAFGTGHHSTTSLMVRRILDADLKGKRVVDMGTGTGILAILCSLRGAEEVIAVEIDEFAFNNTLENLSLNAVSTVKPLCGDVNSIAGVNDIDLFLANINRNVILDDLHEYARTLKPGGNMFLSGFYEEDVPMITEAAVKLGLQPIDTIADNRWACMNLKMKA